MNGGMGILWEVSLQFPFQDKVDWNEFYPRFFTHLGMEVGRAFKEIEIGKVHHADSVWPYE